MEIKKDLPIPENVKAGRRPLKYPFDEMEVGDCLYFSPDEEGAEVPKKGKKPKAVNAAWQYGYRHKVKFSSRTDDTGVYIWRVE